MSDKVITKQQEEMVSMMLSGEAITDIAKKLHCSRQSIYDWLKKDDVKAEVDRRRHDLINQGNQLIVNDLASYINNIKVLANDKSDKRVSLAANQYLINRIYGNPTSVVDTGETSDNDNMNENDLEVELTNFRALVRQSKNNV